MKKNESIKIKKNSKILFFDIETAPNLSYTWGKYEQDVIEFERDWYMLCAAYKWLGEKKVHIISQLDDECYIPFQDNDYMIVNKLWELFNEADIIIAHNGQSFDIKKSNARFIQHNLTPPSSYHIIDTKLIAKKYFKFDSNKLDDLGKYLGLGRKIETGGFELWKGCMRGDKKSWAKMIEYNKNDVKLLERVYLKLRPWMTNHPNRGLINEKEKACPICLSNKIQKRGYSYTRTSKFQRWQCQSCGGWSRSRLSELFKSNIK